VTNEVLNRFGTRLRALLLCIYLFDPRLGRLDAFADLDGHRAPFVVLAIELAIAAHVGPRTDIDRTYGSLPNTWRSVHWRSMGASASAALSAGTTQPMN
jgi:hypothetical protein